MKTISEQIDTIRNLKVGWLDGEGLVPTKEELDWVESKIKKFFGQEGMPPIYIYPTPSGGIQIEWSGPFYLEVDLKKQYAEFSHMKGEEIGCIVIPDLKSNTGWKWVAKKVKGEKND